MHGIDAELLTISCAGRGYLNIELLDENPVAEKFRYLHADLPLLSGRNDKLQQISLYENYNLLNAMLACAWNSNSTLCVDFTLTDLERIKQHSILNATMVVLLNTIKGYWLI